MQYRIESVSQVSRHAFHKLVVLWLTIVMFTVAAALLVSASSAKADIILPLPEAQLAMKPAVLKSFSSLPPSALIQQRCHTHITPQKKSVAHSNYSSRNQRNAENQGVQTTSATSAIMAIKAYRQCVSQITLGQLASK